MNPLTIFHILVMIVSAYLCRRPFLNFPLDDDFAIYTYRARFAKKGFSWKNDLQIIGIPVWKMILFDKVFFSPEKGHTRIRHLQTVFHAAACVSIYWVVLVITENEWADFRNTGCESQGNHGYFPEFSFFRSSFRGFTGKGADHGNHPLFLDKFSENLAGGLRVQLGITEHQLQFRKNSLGFNCVFSFFVSAFVF